MSAGDSSKTRSNSENNPGAYQILYEFERRLDDKMHQMRSQTKEDINSALEVKLAPVNANLVTINKRMENGDAKFAEHESMWNDHDNALREMGSACNLRHKKHRDDDSSTALVKKGGFISVDKIPGLLQGLGVLIATILSAIALMRSPQPAATTAPTTPSTTTHTGP